MADVLIRDLPDDVLAAIDDRAKGLGLSRSEYLRRRLTSDANRHLVQVTTNDLVRFGDTHADLSDVETMARAWL